MRTVSRVLLAIALVFTAHAGAGVAQTKANDVRHPPPEPASQKQAKSVAGVSGPMKPGTTPGCSLERVEDHRTLVLNVDAELRRVRLIGVELVPQGASPGGAQDAGRAAVRMLGNLLEGESMTLVVPAELGVDRDAAPFAFVRREPEGLDVGLEMLRQGFAALDSKFDEHAGALPAATVEQYRRAAARAREMKKGLWSPGRALEPAGVSPTPGPAGPAGSGATPETASMQVYVTPSGKKYHREGCKFLGKNARALLLEAARKRYEPCSACNPPK
jgi:endonuclease YncB( thermonuclease family)